MGLFTKKVDNSALSLQAQSHGYLNVFREIVANLKNLNDTASQESARQTDIIKAAEVERENLNTLIGDNKKVIDNITQIIGA